MTVEVRPLGAGDADAIFALRAQAFTIASAERDQWKAGARFDRFVGAFVDGRLAGVLNVLPLRQYFGGRGVPMGGVASVAVLPEHRGRGLAPRLLDAALDAMRENGEVISTLHPATTYLYRRAGWDLGGEFDVHTVAARALASLRGGGGRVRRGRSADLPALRDCYGRVAPARPGWTDRPEWLWSHARDLERDHWYLLVSDRDDGGIDGFVLWEQVLGRNRWGYGIVVHDLVAENAAAEIGLWSALGSHAAQVDTITVVGPAPEVLFLLLPEQELRLVARNAWMTRIVDAPGAIAARGFPAGTAARVGLELIDPVVATNAGRFELEVAGGAGALTPGGDGAARLTINALAMLYTAYVPPSVLRQASLLEADDHTVSTLDAVFRGPRPSIADDF